MNLIIAGEAKEYEQGTTVRQLIEAENVEMPLYVKVSINDEFIDNDNFDTTVLNDGDVIEFLYFMGGGR